MIAQLTGTLIERSAGEVIIDVSGIGYRVLMPSLSASQLPPVGEVARIRTYMHVTDSSIALFGFADADEELLFKQLIGVTGIGPKIALAALSTYSSAQIIEAIIAQDASFLAKVPGLGKKTASRIVLELKDLFPEDMVSCSVKGSKNTSSKAAFEEIVDALLGFGFTTQEIELALTDAPDGMTESELLTFALKRLGGA